MEGKGKPKSGSLLEEVLPALWESLSFAGQKYVLHKFFPKISVLNHVVTRVM